MAIEIHDEQKRNNKRRDLIIQRGTRCLTHVEMIFNLDRIFEYSSNSPERYQLAATLEGHSGPINSLKFNSSGTMLASGGKNIIICLRIHTHNSQGMMKLLGSGMSLRGVRFRFWPILVVDGARSLALTSSLTIALLWGQKCCVLEQDEVNL